MGFDWTGFFAVAVVSTAVPYLKSMNANIGRFYNTTNDLAARSNASKYIGGFFFAAMLALTGAGAFLWQRSETGRHGSWYDWVMVLHLSFVLLMTAWSGMLFGVYHRKRGYAADAWPIAAFVVALLAWGVLLVGTIGAYVAWHNDGGVSDVKWTAILYTIALVISTCVTIFTALVNWHSEWLLTTAETESHVPVDNRFVGMNAAPQRTRRYRQVQ